VYWVAGCPQCLRQWFVGAGGRRQEPAVEVDDSQEFLQVLCCGRLWLVHDGLDAVGQQLDASGGHPVAQEVQHGHPELSMGHQASCP